MKTIRLKAGHPEEGEAWCGGELPEGLMVVPGGSFIFEGKTYQVKRYVHPELGPPRLYDSVAGGVVVPIGGRRYRVFVELHQDDYMGHPEGATVTFVPTDDQETEYEPYDPVEHNKAQLERLHSEAEKLEEVGECDGYLDRIYHNIEAIERGECIYGHSRYAQFFGQPNFVQGDMFAVRDGRAAYNLVTLETGWGDAGNVNVMVSLDDEGVPCAAWFEASCC